LFRRAGVELVGPHQRPQFDETTMETNVPGLYVAGTAVAGTQSSHYKTFLENCHVHVERILRHLRGQAAEEMASPLAEEIEAMPES
jgi:thioredoxin reductase (NADPH)